MLNLILALLLSSLSAFAIIEAPVNPVDFEQNPSHIVWKKIDTENFEIIFPQEIEAEAQRVAHLLEKAYPFVTRSLETKPPRIPLVLQNQSTDSNGFVTLAPRRSEWYMTPSVTPEMTNTEWLKTLAVHEFRHVVQFQKTRQNFNRYFEFFLGQIGQALGLAFTLPPWYLEGDAVGIETALTRGGRGRLPVFERDLRTILLSGKTYDADKGLLRSFKDWVPNHYVYGYFLTSAMRNKYGDLFLSRVADQATVSSWNPLSFYNASDRMLEGSFEQFYEETMSDLTALWKAQYDKLDLTRYRVTSPAKDWGWTNYDYPMVTDDGKIVALKSGLSFIPRFVLIDGEKEEDLFFPARLIQDFPYKLRNGRFAYLELEVDPRWGYRDYTALKVYDVNKRETVLTVPQTKWRLATLDPKGERLLAVDWAPSQRQELIVIGADGEVQKRWPVPREQVITSLDWLSENEAALVVKDFDEQKQIVGLDLSTGTQRSLLAPSLENLGFLTVSEGKVLVESPASGIDNIFSLQDGKLKQLTTAAFGAYAPVLKDGKLIYSNYTIDGMEIAQKEATWDEENSSSGSFVPFYEKFARFEGMDSFAAKLKETDSRAVTDYSQVRNAVNLHSWTILAPPLGPSVMLVGYSRDILNKFSLTGGGEYNLNEKTALGFVSAAWSHYYPVLDLRMAYGSRRQSVKLAGLRTIENKWEEGTLEAGVQVPWKRIIGRFTQNFTVRAFTKFIHVTDKITPDFTDVSDGTLFSPGAELSFSFLQRTTARDLQPPLGISFDVRFEEGKDVTGVDQKGSLLSGDARLFLPGLMRHHSFYHQFAYERQRDDFYQYSSALLYPRGTEYVFLQELNKYSGNYTLPLFYPDAHWSRYVYLKRIALNGFYDHLSGRYRTVSYNAGTAGWEILFDTHLLRLLLPLSWGIRGSYVISGPEKSEESYDLFITSTLAVF